MKLETLDKDVQSIQEARVLARQGKIAAQQFANYTEEQVDRILRNMVKKAIDNAIILAKMAVEETGFGKVEDKVFKNYLAGQFVYNYIKDMKTIGVVAQDTANKNPLADLALRQLPNLRGSQVHTSRMLNAADEKTFQKLGIMLTSEAK